MNFAICFGTYEHLLTLLMQNIMDTHLIFKTGPICMWLNLVLAGK